MSGELANTGKILIYQNEKAIPKLMSILRKIQSG